MSVPGCDFVRAGGAIATRPVWIVLVLTLALISAASDADAARKKHRAPKAKAVAERFDPANYLTADQVASRYGLSQTASNSPGLRLAGPVGVIEGRAGSQTLRVNGAVINLTAPVVSWQGRLMISKSDTSHVIDPLLRPRSIRGPKRVQTVVIDAGHGGHDSGARGRYGREKDFTLDTAKRLEKHLRAAGFRVVMTRSDDVFVPLSSRAERASRERDAVFVSIHFNKGRSRADGVETFALAPPGVPAFRSNRRQPDANPGNVTDGANILLAAKIHRRMAASVQTADRGVKFERFHVLRNNSVPAALVEGGFLSNPADARAIAEPRYRETLARAIAQGIQDYAHAVTHGTQPRLADTAKRRGLFAFFSRDRSSEARPH